MVIDVISTSRWLAWVVKITSFIARLPRVNVSVIWGHSGEKSNVSLFFRFENPTTKAISDARVSLNVFWDQTSTTLTWAEGKPESSLRFQMAPREVNSRIYVELPEHIVQAIYDGEQVFLSVRLIGDLLDQRCVFLMDLHNLSVQEIRWRDREMRRRAKSYAESTKLEDREREVPRVSKSHDDASLR